MDKLTRTYFSYNTREGACETCHGLGEILTINAENVIHESLSLEEGAIDYWGLGYREYQINLFYKTFRNYGIPYVDNTKVSDFDENQKNMLLYGYDCEAIKQAFPNIISPKTVTEARFEGVYANLWRRLSDKGGLAKQLEDYFKSDTCPVCLGERLGELSRTATGMDTRLPELVMRSLDELVDWMTAIETNLEGRNLDMVMPYIIFRCKGRRKGYVYDRLEKTERWRMAYCSRRRKLINLKGAYYVVKSRNKRKS